MNLYMTIQNWRWWLVAPFVLLASPLVVLAIFIEWAVEELGVWFREQYARLFRWTFAVRIATRKREHKAEAKAEGEGV